MKNQKILLFALLAIHSAQCAHGLTPANLPEIQEQAIASFKSGQYDKAVGLYQQLVALQPNNVDMLKDLMWALWNSGRSRETIEVARQVSKLESNDQDSISLMAKAYQKTGRWEKAAEAYEKLLKLSPANVAARFSLVKSYILSKNLKLAEKNLKDLEGHFTAGHELNPRLPQSWNSLAGAYLAAGNKEKAMQAYQHVIGQSEDNERARLGLANLYTGLRKYEEAEKLLLPTAKSNVISPKLARVQYLKRDFAASAKSWKAVTERFPEKNDYKFQMAQALYYGGNPGEAISILENLLDDPVEGRHALDLIVDDAVSRRDYQAAAKILTGNIGDIQPGDERRLHILATVYRNMGNVERALSVADRLLDLNAYDGRALEQKAGCLMEMKQFGKAIKVYKQILELNPANLNAVLGLSDAYYLTNQVFKGLQLIRNYREIDETNPYYMIREASYTFDIGEHDRARQMLIDWIKSDTSPLLPVFVYHGLTPFERDPILGHSEHVTVATFKKHMDALKAAGFTTVTANEVAEWYQSGKKLPENPVMITFDDGRLDSFRHADAVLEANGQKATMFAIIQSIDRNLPNYANWDEIKKYQKTGRWSIQAHGDAGHSYIPIDAAGHKGLYLCNKMWLQDEKRMEFRSEWISRITADHQSAKEKIKDQLGQTPVAFAFPEGNRGHISVPNAPQSAEINSRLASEAYVISFFQDSNGFNSRIRRPHLLNRLEPPNFWNGEDLIRHISDNNPLQKMRSLMLRWAVWDGRTHEAYYWMKEIKLAGGSPEMLAAHESLIHASRGDLSTARQLIDNQDDHAISTRYNREAENTIQTQSRPTWTPSFSYLEDNKKRHNWLFQQSVFSGYKGIFNFRVIHRAGRFTERNVDSVYENALGLGVDMVLGLYNSVEIQGIAHEFNGDAPDRGSGRLDWDSRWTDEFKTTLSLVKAPIFSARSLNNGVTQAQVAFRGMYRRNDDWEITERGSFADLSDDNTKTAFSFDLGKKIYAGSANLFAVYRFTHEDTKNLSPDYYSPNNLIENQLGFRLTYKPVRSRKFEVQYLPGHGKEKGFDGMMIHDVSASWEQKISSNSSIGLFFDWGKTPSYRSDRTVAQFSHRF